MNAATIVEQCLLLSCRQAAIHGISQRTWQHVRDTGEIPATPRGRSEDLHLTSVVLDFVKLKPYLSTDVYALHLGCSRSKISAVFKAHKLGFLWQRLRFAGIELKELDPDLIKARAHSLTVDGPGALVHIDAKRYGALLGGALIVGLTVVDNYSGFTHLYLCPDGRKTGHNTVNALMEFTFLFPAAVRRIYSDNGSEFVNSTVLGWGESMGIDHRTTKPSHAWSNGKAERTQSILKREVVIPALVDSRNTGQMFATVEELQADLDVRMHWYNHERVNGGKINRGLPPHIVARQCGGKNEEEREATMAQLHTDFKANKRSAWGGVK